MQHCKSRNLVYTALGALLLQPEAPAKLQDGEDTQASLTCRSICPSSQEVAEIVESSFLRQVRTSEIDASSHDRAAIARDAVLTGDLDGCAVRELFMHVGELERHDIMARLLPEASAGFRINLLRALRKADMWNTCASGSRRAQSAATSRPSTSLSSMERRQRLRETLLKNHHAAVPPEGVVVEMSIEPMKINSVELKASSLQFSAWLHLQWVDPRLQWNETEWKLSYTTLAPSEKQFDNAAVWVPDIELYNGENSIWRTLQTKEVVLYPNGLVKWSRAGMLNALCRYNGLYNFPNDELNCNLNFGAWSLDGNTQNIIPRHWDGGIAKNQKLVQVQGSEFQDYEITSFEVIRTEKRFDFYDDWWPILIYTLRVRRSHSFYMFKMVIPNLLMAVLSFIQYFVSPENGERLGFGITLILAIFTTDVANGAFMPVCEEQIFVGYVTRVCFVFCFVSLLETGLVIFMFHLEIEALRIYLPKMCHRRLCLRKVFGDPFRILSRPSDPASPAKSFASIAPLPEAYPSTSTQRTEDSAQCSLLRRRLNLTPLFFWTKAKTTTPQCRELPSSSSCENIMDEGWKQQFHIRKHRLYRRAFFYLDSDFTGRLQPAEINEFGRYMLDDWEDGFTTIFWEEFHIDEKGMMFDEFCTFIERVLAVNSTSKHMSALSKLIKGFLKMLEHKHERTQLRWRQRALQIDRFAIRFLIPVYVIFVIVIFSLDFKKLAE